MGSATVSLGIILAISNVSAADTPISCVSPLFHFVPAAVEVLLHATSVARHEDVQVAVERFVLDLARLCSQKKYSYRCFAVR